MITKGKKLYSLRINVSQTVVKYYRSYIKLPDVIANVGGFLEIYLTIFSFFFSFYLDNEFTAFLYTKLFYLEIEEANPSEEMKEQYNVEKNIEMKVIDRYDSSSPVSHITNISNIFVIIK